MVSKGLATVVRYRQDDDQRSSRYDELLTAEAQAIKGSKGIHSKKEGQAHRINDLTVDHSRIKQQYLPSWQRALRTEAIVEFIASGSRFRVYIPKDSCLVTFLLGGITCPRSSRPSVNGAPAQEAQPYGDEALSYVRDRVSFFFDFLSRLDEPHGVSKLFSLSQWNNQRYTCGRSTQTPNNSHQTVLVSGSIVLFELSMFRELIVLLQCNYRS